MNPKNIKTLKILATSLLVTLSFSIQNSCIQQYSAENPPKPNPFQKNILKAIYVNPYPAGSYANFKAEPEYPKTYSIWKDNALYNSTSKSETHIVISLSKQRGILYKGKSPIMDYPISSGTSKYPTPTGNFTILEALEKDKRSNVYGKIYNSSGSVIKSDGHSGKDAALIAKPGNRYEGALMAYWMRLTWDGIGMHQGRVPRYPASHGCIRTYSKAVHSVFHKVKVGTTVKIVK